MNIEVEKFKYPKKELTKWTHSAIYCYLRDCKCNFCMYQEAMESHKCKMKIGVMLLLETIGKPTKRQLEKYEEIEEELKNK